MIVRRDVCIVVKREHAIIVRIRGVLVVGAGGGPNLKT